MTQLSLITHVYNAQAAVDRQVAGWQALPAELRAGLEFIVIDDHSDTPLTVDRGDLNLRLFRVDDDIDWNMPGCRNLAALQSDSPWLLYFDVDNLLAPADLARLLGALHQLQANTLYVFRRIFQGQELEPHINSFLIRRQGFFRTGGYDEDFAGHYGFEDVLFRQLWRAQVGPEVLLTNIAFEQMDLATTGMNRDTTRNQALIQFKLATGLPKARNLVRFGWTEVR